MKYNLFENVTNVLNNKSSVVLIFREFLKWKVTNTFILVKRNKECSIPKKVTREEEL